MHGFSQDVGEFLGVEGVLMPVHPSVFLLKVQFVDSHNDQLAVLDLLRWLTRWTIFALHWIMSTTAQEDPRRKFKRSKTL